jgi:hypothetical protein
MSPNLPDSTEGANPSDVLGQAKQMVSQLQQQAKDGQIDAALLDQLESVLDVSVDTAQDAQAQGASAMNSAKNVTKASEPPPAEGGEVVPPEEEAAPAEPEGETLPADEGEQETLFGAEEEQPAPEEVEPAPTEEQAPPEEEETVPEEEEVNTEEKSKVAKGEQPLSTRPPTPNLIFDHVEDDRAKLPAFIKALSEDGSIKTAQKSAGGSGARFDSMMNMAMKALLDEGGWTYQNLGKLNGMVTETPGNKLAKGITAATVPGIYLIKLAKLMLPLYAGLTNRLPTQSPQGMASNIATWKAQLGYGALSNASFFRVAEAAIGVNPPTSFLTYNAPFIDTTVNDDVSLKALSATAGYSDPMQISVIKAMSALLMGQERVILGSSAAAITQPVPGTPVAGSQVGSTLAAGSYVCTVTALTYEGWVAQSKGGSTAVGESTAGSAALIVTGANGNITLGWAAVPGAVAYNVYVGSTAALATWNKMVTINKAVISGSSTGTTAPVADTTVNAYGMEGLISWSELSTVYGNASPGKQAILDNAGLGLTTGNGGITQFDIQLAALWTNWQIAPSLMVMSPNMNATLVGKLQALGAGNFYRIDVGAERNSVNGGLMVSGYVNKFAPFADGTPRMIDIIPHPYMPDGTILILSETIPYPMGNESRGFVRDILLPYTYFPLPSQSAGVNKLQYNYAITTSQVVECFNPSPQTAIVGVDYTL